MRKFIQIESEDLGVVYADAGPWRSYELTAHGNNFEDLWDSATVSEVDEDGGEIRCYGIEDAPNDVLNAAERLIELELNHAEREAIEGAKWAAVDAKMDEWKERRSNR